MNEITQLLAAIERGDPGAAQQLWTLIHDELRKLAERNLAREQPGQTLQATDLVHEAYLRMLDPDQKQPHFENRAHFFGTIGQAMRRILVERARHKRSLRAGGNLRRVNLDSQAMAAEPEEDLVDLDEALKKLAETYPDKARLVELRYFTGLSGDEAALVLGVSPSTVDRDWRFARAWLRRAMRIDDVAG